MHIDESKKFDRRNIERNLKEGVITLKEYEGYLAKLPDASDKIHTPEDLPEESEGIEAERQSDAAGKKRPAKKKAKAKGN